MTLQGQEIIRNISKTLPKQPGVYQMLDEDGNILLIDEIHTPDSSRYWIAETYEERMSSGQEPQNIDEEIRYTLGLLLKHRGGPGFGHGRLEGQELEALEINLKSITSKLREEVSS